MRLPSEILLSGTEKIKPSLPTTERRGSPAALSGSEELARVSSASGALRSRRPNVTQKVLLSAASFPT